MGSRDNINKLALLTVAVAVMLDLVCIAFWEQYKAPLRISFGKSHGVSVLLLSV